MKRLLLMSSIFLFSSLLYAQSPKAWSIVATYDIAGKASGLAWDGSTYIYYGIYGSDGDHVYRFEPGTGNNSLQFINPAIDDSYGMTWDGQHIWIIDQPSSSANPALATELDLSGTIVSTITLPDHYMSGIAYDNGDFWVCTYYPDPGTIYKVDASGNILTQFQSPGEQPWDICLENGDLWVADYYDDMLYKIDMNGTLIESHPSENIKPSGIVFDDNYLWYCDGQISTTPSILYKVDLGGAGTPAINVPITLHDYGIVTIGNSPVWNMFVSNTGTAPLTINDVDIPGGEPVSTSLVTPVTIDPGNNISIPLIFSPIVPEPLDVIVNILSNDPVDPSVPVNLLGHGVNSGPSALTGITAHDYGIIRMDAHTRWFYDLKNVGDDTLVVSSYSSTGPEFYVFPDDPFPKRIAPLESELIGIWFNPDLPISYSGDILLNTNDPDNLTISLDLDGEGEKKDWLLGEELWHYYINEGYDNSPKAIDYINDITYDSISDVVICSEDNYIRCFNGNSAITGDVMWERKIYSGSVYSQHGIDVLDANADGVEDVIIGTTGGNRSIIALEGKTGLILWQHQTSTYGDGGWVYQVDCSYDYNGDGINDVLASTGDDGGGTGPKRIYCLDALSGESIWECFTNGPNFSCIGVKDFNGDGQADVIGGASSSVEDEGRVYGIDGATGNIEWTYVVNGTSVWAIIQLNDINGDGTPDIAVGDGVLSGGSVYYLDATDGDLIQSAYLGSIINHFARLDDINQDGHPDILVAYGGANGVVLSGLDASTLWFRGLADKAWVADVIGDITGDGLKDAIIGTLYTNNYCYFMDGETGDELEAISFGTPVDAIRAIPDVVGDNSMEMVAGGRNGKVMCYSGGIDAPVGIIEPMPALEEFMAMCYPNPLLPERGTPAKISYALKEGGHVLVQIFDNRGNMVQTLYNGQQPKGLHVIKWNGQGLNGMPLPAGLYYCRISNGNNSTSLKISLL
ncbi:MAG: FlgD immunoglobulin-like domain containing protein [Bacteroidales bacterium]|nr:FlgD immunoglobulin-like domain containing protein [Bacteroidales bacterium]